MRKLLSMLFVGCLVVSIGCQASGPKIVSQPPPGALIIAPQPAPVFFPPAQQTPAYAPPKLAPLPAPRPETDGKGIKQPAVSYAPERNA